MLYFSSIFIEKDFSEKKERYLMKKRITLILTLLMALSILTSCGSAVMMDAAENNYKSEYDYTYSESVSAGGIEVDFSDKDTAIDAADAVEKKIIKTYRIYLESKAFDDALSLITREAERLGGYVSQSFVSGNASTGRSRSASYTVRVPSADAEAYIATISEVCNVRSTSLTTDDITDSYYGSKARMESLVEQERRLDAMMDKAQTLGEMLAIEDKLTDVRAQINALNKQIQLMDKSVDYSYVYVELSEVIEYHVEDPTYLQRLGASFGDSFVNFAEVLGEVLIIFVWILPFLLVGGVIAIVAVTISQKKKRTKKNDSEKEEK